MMISKRMMKGIVVLIGALFVLSPLAAFAQSEVMFPVVVNKVKPLKNVITVAKANGMFTDPVAAVASITDASDNNPYVVVIAPGVYNIASPLQMKKYVDIAGSGENVTKIRGAISGESVGASAIIKGAYNANLSSLTVENTGGAGTYSIALYYISEGYGDNPEVTHVKAIASGSAVCCGAYNDTGARTVMTHVTAFANYGTSSNRAIHNYKASPKMQDVNAYANGTPGSADYGIYNYSSSFSMYRIMANAGGGTHCYGVYNRNDSYPSLYYSFIVGGTDGLYTESGSSSKLIWCSIAQGVSGSGSNQCFSCEDGLGNGLTPTCE